MANARLPIIGGNAENINKIIKGEKQNGNHEFY